MKVPAAAVSRAALAVVVLAVAGLLAGCGSGCPQGILDQAAPAAGAVQGTQVWGGSAQVRLRGDTVFLSRFHDGWRVLAAGCVPRAGKPYDCELAGG